MLAQRGAEERFGGRQHLPEDPLGAIALGQISAGVVDRALEHVKLVAQVVELGPRHHQLGLAEAGLLGPQPALVLPLPAGLAAEHPRAPGARPIRQRTAAPPAPLTLPWFRH